MLSKTDLYCRSLRHFADVYGGLCWRKHIQEPVSIDKFLFAVKFLKHLDDAARRFFPRERYPPVPVAFSENRLPGFCVPQ